MRRRIFNLASAVSLLLFICTIAIWLRSYHLTDQFTRSPVDRDGNPSTGHLILFQRGTVLFEISWVTGKRPVGIRRATPAPRPASRGSQAATRPTTGLASGSTRPPPLVFHHLPLGWTYVALNGGPNYNSTRWEWKHLGFGQIRGNHTTIPHNGFFFTGPMLITSVPIYSMALLVAVLPVSWLAIRVRNSRRIRSDHCPTCGYSLTGNTSGTCPECGTAVPQRSRPA
jgi:hypothetical protein